MNKPEKLSVAAGQLQVPAVPIIPFIAGDGIGPEIWQAARQVFDAAVKRVYGNERRVEWKQELAGQVAYEQTGSWLPAETLQALRTYLVAIKGPLTTPVGEGHRSINVTLRQQLDLFACVRPVRYFAGTPSPVKHPERVDITVFRENTEDIYAGIDFAAHTSGAQALLTLLQAQQQADKVRFPQTAAFALKPISSEGSKRIVTAALEYALAQGKQTVTLVHKGNIMKKTEGGFKQWGYEAAAAFGEQVFTTPEYEQIWQQHGAAAAQAAQQEAVRAGKVIVNDIIADNFFQQALLQPEKFSVVVTTNLNGDYISDALAAQVGGIGISPGANINYQTKRALFEATHGTAPQFAGQNKLNPTSLILSGAMLFEYLGWTPVAELLRSSIGQAIAQQHVTMDFARALPAAVELSTSGFAAYLTELIAQSK
ncbi:NADP-dependent isocitrate dehydrogenase [Liquorilactobacillus satsumensis]|uniref:NADP-dependent isocitrate dehydrogenase n=1 Tax=Liquorilactobacillus satsumensis TaxID=259059 RepID=UPI0021C3A2BD|nr:NADP-dependent isocitrate dehydrogenase [Liquorilactobacillus satsumensis]MCP9311700.1 NADP-dependent isocitrate dehydrogenase [Liquorilactobacillus satsumensis]MCP9358833.1 NADP-dependent isocitrate dehydrogenase [Liquorilactobacillus satsumensis]